jgi:mono/diheme cytochrome c family protein
MILKEQSGKYLMENKFLMKRLSILFILFISTASTVFAQTKKPATTAKPAIKKAVVANPLQASLARGKSVYTAQCLSCHQADGGGVPNLNPPLIKTQWVLGNKAELIQWVLKGSRGKVEIDGERFHNTMPPQAYLTDQQIADALTYIRNSFGNKASAVQPADVKSVRAK